MFHDSKNLSIGRLINEFRQLLTQPYSTSNLLVIQEKYATIIDLADQYSLSKELETSGYKPNNDKAYKHHILHFQTDIINFLLAHLNTDPQDEEATHYLMQIIKMNLQIIKCEHHPVRLLHADLSNGMTLFPASLNDYKEKKKPEKNNGWKSYFESGRNFLGFGKDNVKVREKQPILEEVISRGYGSLN